MGREVSETPLLGEGGDVPKNWPDAIVYTHYTFFLNAQGLKKYSRFALRGQHSAYPDYHHGVCYADVCFSHS